MDTSECGAEICSLDDLRADIPLTRQYIYLNSCTFGPVPRSIQACMADALRAENEEIIAIRGKEAGVRFYSRAEQARGTLADLLGVSAGDVAWTYNTTTATRLAIMGIGWQPGDKLAVTDVEHVSTNRAAAGLAQSRGVETTVIPSTGPGEAVYAGPDLFLEQLDRLLTPAHRMLVMSHVSNIDGRRLPVTEAARMARARGVRTLVDGAQSLGIFTVDAAAIGADFYSGSVHKWLLGPPGIGFLFVSSNSRKEFNPFDFLVHKGDTGDAERAPMTASALCELGTANYALRIGAGACVETARRIGLGKIEERCRLLTARLRAGLRLVPGIRVASPEEWELSSSVTTIQLDEGTPERCQRFVERLLEEYGIVVKYRPEICGVRIGVAGFNTNEEIEQFLAATVHLIPQI